MKLFLFFFFWVFDCYYSSGAAQNLAFIGYTYKSFDAVKARFGDFDANGFVDVDELTCQYKEKEDKKGKGKRGKGGKGRTLNVSEK